MANIQAANNICGVHFFITLNLKDCKNFDSDVFYVRGNPWLIEVKNKDEQLAVYLISLVKDKSKNWAIVAKLRVKLVSLKTYGMPEPGFSNLNAFHFGSLSWGCSPLISLTELENEYLKNGTFKLEINLDTSPLLDVTKDDWIKFERTLSCCDANPNAKFRVTVNNFDGMFSFCSPEFIVNNFPWRLSIYEFKRFNSANDDIQHLQIKLRDMMPYTDKNWFCQATMICTLISFDQNVASVRKEVKDVEFKFSSFFKAINITAWNEFINPKNKFIQDGSFIIEIELNIKNGRGFKLEIPKCVGCDGAVKLICVICHENLVGRKISSLLCGHVFCTACITVSLQRKSVCPTCDREATEQQLIKIFLPTQ